MANSIAEALGNFAQFLGQEQQFLANEERKDLIRASTQRISEAFSKVSPLATEGDVRQLMLDTISDAAGLGTLDTSMPLIQGLYSDSINAIKNYKAKREDEALKLYAKNQGLEDVDPAVSGTAQINLLQYEEAQRKGITIEEEDATYSAIIDPRTGQEIPDSRLRVGPSWQDKLETEGAIRSRYTRQTTPFRNYAGTTPEGLPITMDARTGQFFVPDEEGLIPYTGQVMRGTQSALKDARNKQVLYKESKNSTYQEMSGNAVVMANQLNLTDSQGNQLKGSDAFNKFYKMSEAEFMTNIQKLDDANQNMIKQQWDSFKEMKKTYDYYQGELRGTADVISYDEAKKIYNLSDEEFKSGYNAVVGNINDTSKPNWMSFIRSKVRAAVNKSETETATWTEEDWLKAWHNLNNKTKGSIMNAIRNNNKGNNAQ